jgi:hypothetical protein
MNANDAAFCLMAALCVANLVSWVQWVRRAKRYEFALKLARGLIAMNRADYALHHIKEALERR